MAKTGFRISCGGWPNAPRTWDFSCGISSVDFSPKTRSRKALTRFERVDGEVRDVARFFAKSFGGASEDGERRVVRVDDVAHTEKADRVGGFTGTHGVEIADGKKR